MAGRSNATRGEVARRAGVSTAVVSYVVNNGPRPVAAETRERVLAAIAELGYVPNDSARRMRGAGGSTIGYLVPSIRNPFFAEMTSAFNRALRDRGYHLLLADLDNDTTLEKEYLELFRGKQVDGVIAWASASADALVSFLTESRIPFALVATRHPGASSVTIDEEQAAALAVAHLKDLGHTRVAYLGPCDASVHPQSRLPHVRAALERAHLTPDDHLFIDLTSPADAPAAVGRLLNAPHPASAAIVHNDDLAMRVVSLLKDRGCDVPGDVSIVSYDDLDLSHLARVPLTSVSYSKEGLGSAAVDIVLRHIEGADETEHRTFPVHLVVRASTRAI